MKSFKEFNIIIEGRSREEAERSRQAKPNPGNWTLENAGSSINPSWRVKKKSGGSGGSSGGRATASASKASEKAIQQRQVASAAQGRKKTVPQPVTKKPEAKPAPKKSEVRVPEDEAFYKKKREYEASKKPAAKKVDPPSRYDAAISASRSSKKSQDYYRRFDKK